MLKLFLKYSDILFLQLTKNGKVKLNKSEMRSFMEMNCFS